MTPRGGRSPTGTAVRGSTIRTASSRGWEVGLALASVASVIAALLLLRSSTLVVGLVFVVVLAMGAAPFVILALAAGKPSPHPMSDAVDEAGSVTTVVRVGGEPRELVEACVAIARCDGPTVVVAAGRDDLVAPLGTLGVTVHTGATVEGALAAALPAIETTAVLIVQPGAVPVASSCVVAARQLDTRIGWVVGRVREFEEEGFAPDCREVLGARLRSRARAAGLVLWERDATLVSADLLRRHPLAPGRPWGAWLRARAAEGHVGVEVDSPFALRTVPAGATEYWPTTVARQRAFAADLASAAASHGPLRTRLLAASLLGRELYAYPLAVLLLAPLLLSASDAFPFACSPGPFLAVVAALAAARWVTFRTEHGVALHPVEELVAAADDAPGSVQAVVAACTRRVGTVHGGWSPRLLVWAMLAFSIAALAPFVDRPLGGESERLAAGLALVVLALLWLFALRLFAQRRWTRRVGRIRIALAASVQGRAGHTVDASPSGLAVMVPGASPEVGDVTSVTVTFPDDTAMTLDAVVTNRRNVGGNEIVGLAFVADPARRAEWVRRVFDQLQLDDPSTGPSRAPLTRTSGSASLEHRAIEVADRFAIGLTVALSLVVLSALMLGALGYRISVVRSGSMAPTLRTGDLVVEEDALSRDLSVGEIVSFQLPGGDDQTIIHRVRHVTIDHETLTIETRGDANLTSEEWTTSATSVVGVYRWRVPAVGRFVSWLRAPGTRWALLVLAFALAAAALLRAAVGSRQGAEA